MKRVLLTILCALFIQAMQAQDPNFHIYLCFGQSNMEGQGTIETQDQTVNNRFQIFQSVDCSGKPKEKWRTATPPLCRCNTKLGPGDYFGREMVNNLPSNVKIGIVHVSIAGCKIELFDKVNYQAYINSLPASDQWMKNIINEYGGNPYARLVALAKLAQKDGVIKGILLHQGESNTGDQGWPNKVKGVYNNLLTDLNLSASNVPLLVGQMVDAAQGGACASMNTIINQLPNTIPTAHVISSSGCTDQTDNLHFNSAGYRLLGTRYAQKMLSLLPPTSNTPPTVSIIAPANNTLFTAPASITISANAADANGTVTNVQFFSGTTLLGSDVSVPYSFNWNNVTSGTYTITARATDNGGVVTTSSPINITVAAPQTGITIQAETACAVNGTSNESINTGFNGTGYVNTDNAIGAAASWSVQSNSAQTITLGIRYAHNTAAGRSMSLSVNNTAQVANIPFPSTGNTNWTVANVQIFLSAGNNTIKLSSLTTAGSPYIDELIYNASGISAGSCTATPNQLPSVAITAPTNGTSYASPASITISANAADVDGTVSNVQFFNGTTLLGTDATSPYSFTWANVTAGTYSLTAKATDNAGAVTTSSTLSVVVNNPGPVQTPFNGSPSVIPGIIQAEHYDFGGEGVSFHETTTGNSGNSTLRNGDPVDIETTTDGGGGINVGWIAAGEWLEYTVNVTTAGVYRIEARVAATSARTFHIEMDGVNSSGTITIPNTGGFQVFQTVTVNNINLTVGQKIMRIVMDASYFNLNYVNFIRTSGARTGESEDISFSVSPNPTDQNFTFSAKEAVQSFMIINNQGIEVYKGNQIMEGESILLGDNLSAGIYLLKVQYANGRTEIKKIRKD